MINMHSLSNPLIQTTVAQPFTGKRDAEITKLKEEISSLQAELYDSYSETEPSGQEIEQRDIVQVKANRQEIAQDRKPSLTSIVITAITGLVAGGCISEIQKVIEQDERAAFAEGIHDKTGENIRKKTTITRRVLHSLSNVDKRDGDGRTSLHKAKNRKEAESLIRYGADVNAMDNNGYTPLHLACEAGNRAVVESLISEGADINAREDHFGKSPLFCAIFNSNKAHEGVIELLISKGADVNFKDDDGKTLLWHLADNRAYNIENRDEHRKIAAILREHGARG